MVSPSPTKWLLLPLPWGRRGGAERGAETWLGPGGHRPCPPPGRAAQPCASGVPTPRLLWGFCGCFSRNMLGSERRPGPPSWRGTERSPLARRDPRLGRGRLGPRRGTRRARPAAFLPPPPRAAPARPKEAVSLSHVWRRLCALSEAAGEAGSPARRDRASLRQGAQPVWKRARGWLAPPARRSLACQLCHLSSEGH